MLLFSSGTCHTLIRSSVLSFQPSCIRLSVLGVSPKCEATKRRGFHSCRVKSAISAVNMLEKRKQRQAPFSMFKKFESPCSLQQSSPAVFRFSQPHMNPSVAGLSL